MLHSYVSDIVHVSESAEIWSLSHSRSHRAEVLVDERGDCPNETDATPLQPDHGMVLGLILPKGLHSVEFNVGRLGTRNT